MSKFDILSNGNAVMEDVQIIQSWSNFSGRPDTFNPNGGERYCVIEFQDDEFANELLSRNWNVRKRDPREEGDPYTYTIQAKIKYGGKRPPRIFKVTSKNTTLLDEYTVSTLDLDEIEFVDVELRAWEYEPGKPCAMYVRTMYVNIAEDIFAAKYAGDDDMPPFDE